MKIKSTASLIYRSSAALLRSPGGQTGVAGVLAGFYLLGFCHQILATFGTSLIAVTSLAAAISVGLEFGLREPRRTGGEVPFVMRPAVRNCLLAAWALFLPWLIELTMLVAAQIPAEVMAAPGRLLLFQVLAGMLLLSFPVFLLARTPILLFQSFDGSEDARNTKPGSQSADVGVTRVYSRWSVRGFAARLWNRRRAGWSGSSIHEVIYRYLVGAVSGLVGGILVVAPWFGVHVVTITAACGSFCIAGAVGYRWLNGNLNPQDDRSVANESAIATRREPVVDTCWQWLAAACLGGLLAVVFRMIGQLASAASFLVYIEWAAILAGVSFGMSRRLRFGTTRSGVCLSVAAWGVIVLASYSLLTDVSLLVNAYISVPWMLIASRVLLVAAVLVPFGFAWGRLATTSDSSATNREVADAAAQQTPHETEFPALQVFAFTAGYLSTRWVAFPRWETADLLWAIVWTLAGLAAFRVITRRRFALPQGRRRRAALVFAVGALALVPFVRDQYDPVKTARQLFATNVFVARMQGLDAEQLSFLDEGRNIARREGERGTLTVWRYRGNQLQIRESGVPKAIVSTNPRICPHFTAEVMQAVMPLALHESPRRVMILGLGGGVPLTTSLAFPVLQVTCVDSDQQLLGLLQNTVWSESGNKPMSDVRLQYLSIDPAMAVACRGGDYDVVISSPDQSALLQTTPYFTRGFYRGVSRQLAEDGIFCQRFHQVDYGPMPLQTAVKTLQTVFRNVVAIEIASGEMALLATNSEKGLSREGILSRFRAAHVSTALAEVGWDWAIPMNLTAFGHDGLSKFADATPNSINTAANGRLAFRLPQEVMRWGPKWQELLTLIGPHGTRFAESEGLNTQDSEFLRRLSEVTGQRKLMTSFPDQWWAYRKSLKKQIRERPRTLIQKVSAESNSSRFHPEDRRRMRYFAALDRATKNPTIATIERISSFEEPYDPLLSYFVHQEAAELYERSTQKDDREELRHRLHTVYFAHPHDRSIRNIAAAISLAAKREAATKTPTERWDQLNSLMQVMKGRWAVRGLVKPKSSQIVLNDIETSLGALGSAIEAMEAIRADVGISQADWDARHDVLKRGLIRPLKTYRKNLLAHHLQERHKLKKLLENPPELEDEKSKPGSSSSSGATAPTAN